MERAAHSRAFSSFHTWLKTSRRKHVCRSFSQTTSSVDHAEWPTTHGPHRSTSATQHPVREIQLRAVTPMTAVTAVTMGTAVPWCTTRTGRDTRGACPRRHLGPSPVPQPPQALGRQPSLHLSWGQNSFIGMRLKGPRRARALGMGPLGTSALEPWVPGMGPLGSPELGRGALVTGFLCIGALGEQALGVQALGAAELRRGALGAAEFRKGVLGVGPLQAAGLGRGALGGAELRGGVFGAGGLEREKRSRRLGYGLERGPGRGFCDKGPMWGGRGRGGVRAMATKAGKMRTVYVCSDCGEGFAQWFGWCQACNAEGTLTRMSVPKDAGPDAATKGGGGPGMQASRRLSGAPASSNGRAGQGTLAGAGAGTSNGAAPGTR